MRARLTHDYYNGTNYGQIKETIATVDLIGFKRRDGLQELVSARFYRGRSRNASQVFCTVWIHGRSSGTGKAGGYGYCKKSAAFAAALEQAGIILTDDKGKPAYISGTGMTAVHQALKAIGRALGYRKVHLVCNG